MYEVENLYEIISNLNDEQLEKLKEKVEELETFIKWVSKRK